MKMKNFRNFGFIAKNMEDVTNITLSLVDQGKQYILSRSKKGWRGIWKDSEGKSMGFSDVANDEEAAAKLNELLMEGKIRVRILDSEGVGLSFNLF